MVIINNFGYERTIGHLIIKMENEMLNYTTEGAIIGAVISIAIYGIYTLMSHYSTLKTIVILVGVGVLIKLIGDYISWKMKK